jgi:hypothetical protein
MKDEILQEQELEALGRLQFDLMQAACLLGLDNVPKDGTAAQRAWQRGVLQAQREVRQVLYESAKAGATSQSIAGFLKLAERFQIEDA